MARKLHYFKLNGLAEPIRYLLHYGGLEFEDIRYAKSEWPSKSVKDMLPFGQLPLYEEGGKSLNQSVAIARYVANQISLLPSDPWEQAVLDAIVLNIYDFWANVVPHIIEQDPAKQAVIRKKALEVSVPFFLPKFEKQLKDNNGYLTGKLSWADFILVGIIESTDLFLTAEVEQGYPSIIALIQKIRALPGVKEYIASSEPYKLSAR